MHKFRKFVVTPSLPPKLAPLLEVARNVWWIWNPDAIALLRRVDPDLWEELGHNPIPVLGSLSSERFNELARDQAFLAHLESVHDDLQRYLQMPSWFDEEHPNLRNHRIGYFSFEFGLHESSAPLFGRSRRSWPATTSNRPRTWGSLWSASAWPTSTGYFRQYLNHDGWQQEDYPVNDFYNMVMTLEKNPDGTPVLIEVEYPGRAVKARIWRIQVGRNPLFLLDTNLFENRPEDRELTSKLYGGDTDMRIRQEILLGIGGMRALKALGLEPSVCHLNEGHSAFLALERIRLLMEEQKLTYAVAFELVRATNVFTTHTPVPAGNDYFDPDARAHLPQGRRRPARHRHGRSARTGPAGPERQVRNVLHDRARAAPQPVRQRRQRAARPRVAQYVEEDLAGRAGATRSPSPTSPTASIRAAGCARDRAAVRPLSRPPLVRQAHEPHGLAAGRPHSRRRTLASAQRMRERLVGLRAPPSARATRGARREPGLRSRPRARCSIPTR